MKGKTILAGLLLAAALGARAAHAQALAASPLTAVEIMERSQAALFYPGDDLKARVTMKLISATGSVRTRVLTMLRRNQPGSRDQRFFMYFHEPGDVRRTAFLVFKYPDRDDDRWIFIPAVNMVRRVAAQDSRSSFVGSDFSYEDVSGRDLGADTHTLLREEELGEAGCWVIQSVPKAAIDYTRKLAWIDKTTFLPRREEYYDARNELARVFSADAIEAVAAPAGKTIPTITRRTMANLKSGHRTEVAFDAVGYDVGLEEAVFTEGALANPPQRWIR